MQRPSGFTLVETLASLSVLSIVLAVGLPAFSALLQHQRAASAMSALVSQMNHARLASVKHRRPTILCPSVDGLRCSTGGDWSMGWILFVERGDARGPQNALDLLQTGGPPVTRHLQVRSSSGRSRLRYLPDGRSSGSNLTLRVCTPEGEQLGAVIVNNAGRPRVERGPPGQLC